MNPYNIQPLKDTRIDNTLPFIGRRGISLIDRGW